MKQETIKMRAPWLTALMAGAMLVSCSNDMQMPSGGADGSAEGKVTFNISLPSTEKVIYGGDTRALHDEAEYNVTTLDVYEYDVNTGFVAKHTFSAADGSIRPAGEGNITGEYTVTITEDLAEVGSLRRFYFVANNANGVTPAKGTDYETGLRDEAADIALASGTGSSVLCPEGGIAMSGLAVNTETNGSDITIKSGAMNNVHVDLTRIVGRVDLYSNADNLVITGARMEKAAEKGYLMADHSLTSTDMPGEIEMLEINANAGVAASGEACLPVANSGYSEEISAIQQYNDGNGTGVRKAFYMYERDNSEGDCTQIVVSYALADGTTGEAVVPFTKTDETTGAVSYVNIERNHLYKVVLGNGEDITPGSEVEVKIIDTPWNVVDLPVVVEKPVKGPFEYSDQYFTISVIDGTAPDYKYSFTQNDMDLNSVSNYIGLYIALRDYYGISGVDDLESLSGASEDECESYFTNHESANNEIEARLKSILANTEEYVLNGNLGDNFSFIPVGTDTPFKRVSCVGTGEKGWLDVESGCTVDLFACSNDAKWLSNGLLDIKQTNIPKGLQYIGEDAFTGSWAVSQGKNYVVVDLRECSNLEHVPYPQDNPQCPIYVLLPDSFVSFGYYVEAPDVPRFVATPAYDNIDENTEASKSKIPDNVIIGLSDDRYIKAFGDSETADLGLLILTSHIKTWNIIINEVETMGRDNFVIYESVDDAEAFWNANK